MWPEIFGLVGIYATFRWLLSGPAWKHKVHSEQQWDDVSVDASDIDHDIVVFKQPDDLNPDNIGKLRYMQEKRNMRRAIESRPMLDTIHFTRDNSRKLEMLIE